jgi:predicted ATPase
MPARLKSIRIQNYRPLADVSLDLDAVNVLFGPSGAGKSSLLDTIRFVRDCVEQSVEWASAKRGHGLGLLNDAAAPGEPIRLRLTTDQVEYELTLGLAAGRIDPLAGERLYSLERQTVLLERRAGSATANLLDVQKNQVESIDLRAPEKLALTHYHDLRYVLEVLQLEVILLSGRLYHSRSFKLTDLKRFGSAIGIESHLLEEGENLWSVLRILESQRLLDARYATIVGYMAEAFPMFQGLVIDQTGPSVLYARFLERDRRTPVLASGMSDGHLQFLILLTVLFLDPPRSSLVLLDEPETSLHPWALAVLAKAITEAAERWGRQVIVATHSPVLISQFEPDQLLAVESKDGRAQVTRLSEIDDIQDLLQEYAAGSLYMSEVVAPQSKPVEPSTSGR